MVITTPKPIPQLSRKYIDRFRSRVDRTPEHGPNGDCWPWISTLTKDGAGCFMVVIVAPQKLQLAAHRVAYFLTTGINPGQYRVLQTCGFAPCCNGDHLILDDLSIIHTIIKPHGDQPRRLIRIPNHPRASDGYVFNYVIIAERAIGRFLPRRHPVHHVDSDSLNDINTNLVICQDNAYHMLLHARTRIVNAGDNPDTQRICFRCDSLKLRTEIAQSGYCWPCARAKTAEWRLRRNQQAMAI